MKLKNRKEVVEQLTEMLIEFDKDLRQYQTDVYLYYDEETQTAKLDTFINVGGNSWIDDDHYTIYRDPEHYDSWEDYFCNTGDFAQGLEMTSEDFENEVKEYLKQQEYEVEEEYKPEWYEEREYIRSKEEYCDKLYQIYVDYLEDQRAEYAEKAEQIISEWEESEEE